MEYIKYILISKKVRKVEHEKKIRLNIKYIGNKKILIIFHYKIRIKSVHIIGEQSNPPFEFSKNLLKIMNRSKAILDNELNLTQFSLFHLVISSSQYTWTPNEFLWNRNMI